jgi:hypothetical protein
VENSLWHRERNRSSGGRAAAQLSAFRVEVAL